MGLSRRPVPLPIATVGLGGYGDSISRLLERQSREADPPVRLVGVYEPDAATHRDRMAELRASGVAVAASYDELLSGSAEAVWLPIPIHLHRAFTERALAAGKAVMCEKPAAGSIDDLRAMRVARDRAGRPVAIGFQDLYDPATHAAKRRLLDGAIGAIRSATLLACWPRDESYYGRNAWAGAFRRDGIWVLDSPLSNAISHYVNLALFWLGETPAGTATPLAVEAELYRVNAIENFDTCALRITLPGDVLLVVLLTHACRDEVGPQITISGTRGTLATGQGQRIVFRDAAGAETDRLAFTEQRHALMVRQFTDWVRGLPGADLFATLEQAEAHLTVCNGASEAATIAPVPAEAIEVITAPGRMPLHTIKGIEEVFAACARRGRLPSESGMAGWSVPAGWRDLRGYAGFAGPRG